MEKILKLDFDEALRLSNNSMTCYVLPRVAEFDDPEETGIKTTFCLTLFHNNEVYLIKKGLDRLGDDNFYRAAMQLIISVKPNTDDLVVQFMNSRPIKVWRKGATIGDVTVCYGQGLLITAPPGGGKSRMTRIATRNFELYNSKVTCYRNLFGERNVDDIGPNTVDCDSSGTVEFQLYILYKEISKALRKAYNGEDVVIAIDSLTRMVEALTNKYAHSHMLSGGISASVKKMVGNLFRMSGQLGHGTLTIIGTCLWAKSNNTWKSIYSELSSIATAEFFPQVRSGKLDSSRKEPSNPENYIKIGSVELHY